MSAVFFTILLQKLSLGVTLAAPIGPVSLEMIKRGLTKGFFAAFTIRLGAALGNILCLILAYFGLSFIAEYPILQLIIWIFGAGVMMFLGVQSIRKSFSTDIMGYKTPYNNKNALLLGFILAIANPVGIVFWIGIFGASMGMTSAAGAAANFSYDILIIAGVLLWGAFLSCCLAFGKRFMSERLLKGIFITAGISLIVIGLTYGYSGIQMALNFL
jgi:L-lysine exporter family protein LysE/ArgO